MSWFPLNRERYTVLDYPDNQVYAFVMSRINYGVPSRQMGLLVQQGQCVLTHRIIANKTGVKSRGAVRNALKRLRMNTDPVPTAHTIGKRAMRITVPPDYLAEVLGGGTTDRTTDTVSQPVDDQPVKVKPAPPAGPPTGPRVLQNRYDTTTLIYRVAKVLSVGPTPGLAEALRNLNGYSDDEIVRAIDKTHAVNPPKTSVPGWIRTVIGPGMKGASQDKLRSERQKPKPLPPRASQEDIDEGLKQFREALDASKCEAEDQPVG